MLDPGHASTSLSADHIIQFTRAVGYEVVLASYRLLESLLLLARGVDSLGGREELGQFLFLSLIGSTVADSLASETYFPYLLCPA